jgi:hypothetical protein
MVGKIVGFELRYQLRNPVLWVAVGIFFLLTFGATASDNIQIGGGGNVNVNSPAAILQTQQLLTLFYMFVTTAFVANVVVRDEESGFGPMVRSTQVTKSAYLLGRFTGAFIAAADQRAVFCDRDNHPLDDVFLCRGGRFSCAVCGVSGGRRERARVARFWRSG